MIYRITIYIGAYIILGSLWTFLRVSMCKLKRTNSNQWTHEKIIASIILFPFDMVIIGFFIIAYAIDKISDRFRRDD